ncbi:MAG: hypothetical protein QXT45_04710 [Candidatus Bilamarchaeaceae archaeon]
MAGGGGSVQSRAKTQSKITPASAKDKGRRLQRWVCDQVAAILGVPCGYDEHVAPREMGQNGSDIRVVGDYKDQFPFYVECKWQEVWSLPSWISITKVRAGNQPWMIVMKRNRQEPVVVVDAEVFFSLLGELVRRKKNG